MMLVSQTLERIRFNDQSLIFWFILRCVDTFQYFNVSGFEDSIVNGIVWRTETDCEMMIWIWSVSRYLVIHFIKMIMYDSEIAINIRLKIGVNEWWITSQCWLTYYCSFDISFFSGQAPLYFADCCLCTVTYSVERMILIVAIYGWNSYLLWPHLLPSRQAGI